MNHHSLEYWALVTGGSSGIGKECVRLLCAQKKCNIVFTYRSNQAEAQHLIEQLKQDYPQCLIDCYPLDLSSTKNIEQFAETLKQKKYQFNRVIHNAAVGTATVKAQLILSEKNKDEEDLTFLKINGLGPILLQEAIDSLLVEESTGTGIVFVGSVGGGVRPFIESSPGDTSSKAYLDFRVQDLAMRNLRTHRHIVRVNPGATDTNMYQKSTLDQMSQQERARFEDRLPKRKVFSPEKVAAAIVHHVDPDMAPLYHGASISLSGGLHLHYAPLVSP